MNRSTFLQPVDNNTMEKNPASSTATDLLTKAERHVQALTRLGKKPTLKVCHADMGDLTYGSEASMLAPDFCKKFVSYIIDWLVICGWQAILASSGYLGGNMILALARLNHADCSPALWQGAMVYWAVMAVAILINTWASKILPKPESFILILPIAGFFAILVPLVTMAPKKVSAHDVFTAFEKGGGWLTTTVSVFVGLLGSVFATYGTDCAVHMAEEIHGANTGFAMLIVVLFVTVDIEAVLASPTGSLGFPFTQIFHDATGSLPGATAMICIIIIMDTCAAKAFLATASRIVLALGCDRGLPFWRTMSTVQPDSAISLHAIVAGVSCTIGPINIGSAIAFNAIISVGVSSLYVSYVSTESMLLWHRIRGSIHYPNQMAGTTWHPNELL
ncbi:MAG: hypothetical protein Q9173_004615 [Seirophora scorigena]